MLERLRADERARVLLLATAAFALTSAFCVSFLAVRAIRTEHYAFGFFVWNLTLAWVPWLAAVAAERARGAWLRVALLAGWLLFLPNALYVVTDLWHIRHPNGHFNWFDLMMGVSFAWTSALLGFGSLVLVQRLVTGMVGSVAGWAVAFGSLGLSGLGVYLGRFRRWNSWDTLLDPRGLLADLWHMARHPFAEPRTIAFSILFAAFGVTTYLVILALGRLATPAAPAVPATRRPLI